MLYYFFRKQEFFISKWLFFSFEYFTWFEFFFENLYMFYKDRLFKIVQKINSKNIKTRTHDLQRHKDEYTIFKLNFV